MFTILEGQIQFTFRANNGQVGGLFAGAPLLLLHTGRLTVSAEQFYALLRAVRS